jgi:hypothetical protein
MKRKHEKNEEKLKNQTKTTNIILSNAWKSLKWKSVKAEVKYCGKAKILNREREDEGDLRVLPSLVMNEKLPWALLVLRVGLSGLENFGFIQQVVMEAEHLLILVECRGWRCHRDCALNAILMICEV